MKPVAVETLIKVLNAELPHGNTHSSGMVTSVSTDSRTSGPGDCFFAIKGPNFDGHDYINEAVSKGAVCVIAARGEVKPEKNLFDAAVLSVADTTTALGSFARWYRKELKAKVVAITGSAGKTTTRGLIYNCLRGHFNCFEAPKSFNNNIGLPLSLLGAEAEHEVILVELGSNFPGEIGNLSDIAGPDIAVITNIHPAHLGGFGSIEAIIREKVSICKGLRSGGKLFINGDFEQLAGYCGELGLEFTTFGTGAECDIRATGLSTSGLSGELRIDDTKIEVPLAGTANLENVVGAWSVCREIGLSLKDFAVGIETAKACDMRLEVEVVGSLTVINDCYNANPASMANALDCLGRVGAGGGGRKVFICGEMAELGEQSSLLHGRLGTVIAGHNVDLLLAVGPFAETVADAAEKAAKSAFESHNFKNTDALCNKLQEFMRGDDIVLVKGSRSSKLEKAVWKLKEIFGFRGDKN